MPLLHSPGWWRELTNKILFKQGISLPGRQSPQNDTGNKPCTAPPGDAGCNPPPSIFPLLLLELREGRGSFLPFHSIPQVVPSASPAAWLRDQPAASQGVDLLPRWTRLSGETPGTRTRSAADRLQPQINIGEKEEDGWASSEPKLGLEQRNTDLPPPQTGSIKLWDTFPKPLHLCLQAPMERSLAGAPTAGRETSVLHPASSVFLICLLKITRQFGVSILYF